MKTIQEALGFRKMSPAQMSDLRMRSTFELGKWDQQYGDKAVFSDYVLTLESDVYRQLAASAEKLSHELFEAEEKVLQQPRLLRSLGLPPRIVRALKNRVHSASSETVRLCRFDFHPTREGWKISEVNSDVPGGLIESDGWSTLVQEHFPELETAPRTVDLYLDALLKTACRQFPMALMHASAYSDDRQTMLYLQKELRKRGGESVLVNPDNVDWKASRPGIDAEWYCGPVSKIIRFYPGEWMANLNRRTGWEDSHFWDAGTMSNPLCALISQSKRFPLVWDALSLGMDEWRATLPETKAFHPGLLCGQKGWLIKSALGRVGEGIWFPGVSEKKRLRAMLADLLLYPSVWAAQRPFQPLKYDLDGQSCTPCLGLFTVNGRAAGIYGRLANKGMVDSEAQDIAVLIKPSDEDGEEIFGESIHKGKYYESSGIV